MDQQQYLCRQAALTRQWLATQEVICQLTQTHPDTVEQLAILYEVLDAIERDLQQLDARHYLGLRRAGIYQ